MVLVRLLFSSLVTTSHKLLHAEIEGHFSSLPKQDEEASKTTNDMSIFLHVAAAYVFPLAVSRERERDRRYKRWIIHH